MTKGTQNIILKLWKNYWNLMSQNKKLKTIEKQLSPENALEKGQNNDNKYNQNKLQAHIAHSSLMFTKRR